MGCGATRRKHQAMPKKTAKTSNKLINIEIVDDHALLGFRTPLVASVAIGGLNGIAFVAATFASLDGID